MSGDLKVAPMKREAALHYGPAASWQSVAATLDILRDQVRTLKPQEPDAARVDARTVRQVIDLRRSRLEFFCEDLVGEPAWDMLLELFARHLEQTRTSIGSLCASSSVPGTTGLRWIEKLSDEGLLVRENDRNDARRIWVSLSEKGTDKMREFFENAKLG